MEVFSSDIRTFERLEPDDTKREDIHYVVDILEFDPSKLPFKPEIIWASPPCTAFSVASCWKHWKGPRDRRVPATQEALHGIKLVKKTLKLIDELKPKYWFIENPRGMLRKQDFMNDTISKMGGVRNTVTYCQYGDYRMKPTDVWTNCKSWVPRPMCKKGMPCHQSSPLSTQELKDVQSIFRKEAIKIIENEIPEIKNRNRKTQSGLVKRYPHLGGYFETQNIGYVARNEILKKAQDEFFRDQREILDASSLNEEQFKKSIEISSRALTEYILFRQLTIERLKSIGDSDGEAEIHNLILPKYRQFEDTDLTEEIYLNNAWVLDDKYMTYKTVLSDKKMSEIIDVITKGEEKEVEDGKPDIALIFSNDPNTNSSVDVVIVELKKKGITLENAMVVETQLKSRARRLMKYYGNKIQRIWFYGVVEFDKELELHLKGEYKELYSKGKMYYKATSVVIQADPEVRLPIGIFMQDLDSVINDADARNSTFLRLIKSNFIDDGDLD